MTFKVLIRRAITLLSSQVNKVISRIKILYFCAAFPEIKLPFCTSIGVGVLLSATDGGVITVGKNVSFGRNSQVIARGGRITIGDNVHLGTGSIIVCICNVQIGRDTLIAEYVVIRDQDHNFLSRPIRSAGFQTSAIAIGYDCWLGAKATVLRGSTIGNGAVIGAHSLVRGNVPPNTLAAGCPAKVIRKLPAA
jgi:acetyltransferase-like isoleucine patch superfamily enzyme